MACNPVHAECGIQWSLIQVLVQLQHKEAWLPQHCSVAMAFLTHKELYKYYKRVIFLVNDDRECKLLTQKAYPF